MQIMTTQEQPTRKIEIDFMYIDLDTCARCRGTDANLDAAIQAVQAFLKSTGAAVTVRKTLVNSETKAMELGFVSSPTIRVNGQDIALELRESNCQSCGEACACEGKMNCRVWVYQGEEHTVAPVPMIIDAILSAVYVDKEDMPTQAVVAPVPENLTRFFAAKAAKASACCNAEEQATCCEPAQKPTCCAPSLEPAQPAGCGC